MKHTLLAIFFSFFAIAAFSQSSPDGSSSDLPTQTKVTVYPNPATNYISVDRATNIKQISIINLVGRKMKTFKNIVADEQYDVSALQSGMYLVQVIDKSNKIITTQRISKQ